jgi:diacylglycerol kinase (ATP)
VRLTLIHNPTAGDEEHSRQALESLLAAAGHEVTYASTKEADWHEALAAPTDLVVAAGGDGTVCDVFTRLAGRATPATVLPLGSANNVARTLGLADQDPARLARAWEGGVRRAFDVGRLRARSAEARFVESLGGGIFAEVLERAEAAADDPDGEDKERRGLALLDAVIGAAEPHPWGLSLDGHDLSGEYLAVEVMNIREIGPNLALAPAADPGDGLLDLVLIGPGERDRLARLVEARREGGIAAAGSLPVRRGRRLAVGFPAGCPLHVDDEPWRPSADGGPGGAASVVAREASVAVLLPSPP